jgi:molecular chaperone HtpG
MTTATEAAPQARSFGADVAKLLHLMVHSVSSDKYVFLRELISNAAERTAGAEAVDQPADGAPPRRLK